MTEATSVPALRARLETIDVQLLKIYFGNTASLWIQ